MEKDRYKNKNNVICNVIDSFNDVSFKCIRRIQ